MKILPFIRIIPLALFFLGFSLVVTVLVPVSVGLGKYILNYRPPLHDPLVSGVGFSPVILDDSGFHNDFTHASSWFGFLPEASASSSLSYFTLSIPGLGLIDVPVEINGTDLKKNAIHFPGTTLPGEFGNTVIFGHSSLPQLYRPGHPLTVFNRLPDVKIQDQINITYDGIIYRYRVSSVMEVLPDSFRILEQRFDRRRLTLVTCVPLGTYWRRFVAVADLVK